MHQRRNLGARLLEKRKRQASAPKSNPRNQQNAKRIYQPLRHHRPQGLCKGNIIIFGKYSTTRNLSHTGQYQIGGIRYKMASTQSLVWDEHPAAPKSASNASLVTHGSSHRRTRTTTSTTSSSDEGELLLPLKSQNHDIPNRG